MCLSFSWFHIAGIINIYAYLYIILFTSYGTLSFKNLSISVHAAELWIDILVIFFFCLDSATMATGIRVFWSHREEISRTVSQQQNYWHLGGMIFCKGGLSLASTHRMPRAPSHLEVTTKDASRECPKSPGQQRHPRLRAAIPECVSWERRCGVMGFMDILHWAR